MKGDKTSIYLEQFHVLSDFEIISVYLHISHFYLCTGTFRTFLKCMYMHVLKS